MVGKLTYHFSKNVGKLSSNLSKIGIGQGGSLPGYVLLKLGGEDALSRLASEMKQGAVIVTGTNGKTTTTTLLIKLLSNDVQIRRSFENNTINSIATGILKQKGDLGVFEYGIRNMEYGIPDKVQKLIDPIGVVYTTISKEHTQVAGVKNPFTAYYHAKQLLSKEMKRGVVVTNSDDPRTALIGINKQKDIHVNFYGLEIDNICDDDGISIKCPNCGELLNYSHKFLNHRGVYECSCGFKRPEPNVKLTKAEFGIGKWNLTIEGDLYNYIAKKDVSFKVEIAVPPFGFHNIYNTLASITAYATFTPKVENIESTIHEIFDSLDMSFIPPGRFEVVRVSDDKFIGLGQGDNGDALKINSMFMKQYINGPFEFIYTTPDVDEDDIFNDHYRVIKNMNPDHIIVVPGRTSVEKAEEYCEIIRRDFDGVDFYPLGYDEMAKRIEKLTDFALNSSYDYVIMSGCGEEQAMWEEIKKNIINR
ncbi:MAG: UDP-N-acetylmuramyl peptide synthase [Methanobrevibacter sp.]|nr:UDP-N-acetylmuramyl peptide synthase [Methanobrevibacter sp.]